MKIPFNEYPPYMFLIQVSNHCPRAVSLYMDLWSKRDQKSRIRVHGVEIEKTFLISRTKFRNYLMDLLREGLINIDQKGDIFTIEMVGWGEIDAAGKTLC